MIGAAESRVQGAGFLLVAAGLVGIADGVDGSAEAVVRMGLFVPVAGLASNFEGLGYSLANRAGQVQCLREQPGGLLIAAL